jgi:hypothetical protein
MCRSWGRADHPRPARGARAHSLRETPEERSGYARRPPGSNSGPTPRWPRSGVWNFEIEFEALGFRIEPLESDAVRLLAAPEAVTDPEGAFLGALEALVGGEDLAKALACRGSTKFG